MQLQVFDRAEYDQDNSAHLIQRIIEKFLSDKKGYWLYREPEIKSEGKEIPTYTIISPTLGLIFVKVYTYSDEDTVIVGERYWSVGGEKRLSEYNKFRNYVHKISSRIEDPLVEFEELVTPQIFYFFPYISNTNTQDQIRSITKQTEHVVFNCVENEFSFTELEKRISDIDYKLLVNIIQNASFINKSVSVVVEQPAKNISEAIELNNKKIAQFDFDQMAASLTITDKCERIRGLAGSGKTVLLAMKAARLHYKYPEKKIAFVFYTKSLYSQTTTLIRKYYNLIAEDEPNWDNLKILHSWGGRTTGDGFYYMICKENGIPSRPFIAGEADGFARNCRELLDSDLSQMFDCILIDEAQDFPLVFFQLAYKVAREPKKIVIAYDELQTTNNITIPSFEELFGSTNDVPNVRLESAFDYILRKSYRNTLETLLTAFAFGFGFYDELTQIIQDRATWEALGFKTDSTMSAGSRVIVNRPRDNSPNSVLNYWHNTNPVEINLAETSEESFNFIAKQIQQLIQQHGVKPTDILVIDVAMNKTKNLSLLQTYLLGIGIPSYLPGVYADARDFFQEGYVTLSTPRNAKGNEVPIVFVLGCEEIYAKSTMVEKRKARNFMFISITRSKGWVYLCAVGRVKGKFTSEYKKITDNIPNLVFTYPDDEQIKLMAKIDFIQDNPKARDIDQSFLTLRKAVDTGDSAVVKRLLELDPQMKETLRKLLGE